MPSSSSGTARIFPWKPASSNIWKTSMYAGTMIYMALVYTGLEYTFSTFPEFCDAPPVTHILSGPISLLSDMRRSAISPRLCDRARVLGWARRKSIMCYRWIAQHGIGSFLDEVDWEQAWVWRASNEGDERLGICMLRHDHKYFFHSSCSRIPLKRSRMRRGNIGMLRRTSHQNTSYMSPILLGLVLHAK